MSLDLESNCYLIINDKNESDDFTEISLKDNIENGNVEMKLKCLRWLIFHIMKGNVVSNSILMSVIRFLLPSKNHDIKRLLLVFWELLPKSTDNGKLITEMILVVDAYRKDLEHTNEYIRAFTLRFLCKINNKEILESLMPAIKSCLTHTSNFVRRNAVFAIFTVYKQFEHLITDAPQLIFKYLQKEKDMSCIRSAFIMLIQIDKSIAVEYLKSCIDRIDTFDTSLQLIAVEVMSTACFSNTLNEKALFLPVMTTLMNSAQSSNAVKFEITGALLVLSPSPKVVANVMQCLVGLLYKESDNNVRLVVLEKIQNIIETTSSSIVKKEISIFSLDLLSLLSMSGEECVIDLDVGKKIILIAKKMINNEDLCDKATDVISKEILKLHSIVNQKNMKVKFHKLDFSEARVILYLNLLLDLLYSFIQKFSVISHKVVSILVDNIATSHACNCSKIINILKLIIEHKEILRDEIFRLLSDALIIFTSIRTVENVLWLFVMHCKDQAIYQTLFDNLYMMFSGDKVHEKMMKTDNNTVEKPNVLTADGSYITQTALTYNSQSNGMQNILMLSLKSNKIRGISFIAFLSTFYSYHLLSNCDDGSFVNCMVAKAIKVVTNLILELNDNSFNKVKGYFREQITFNLNLLLKISEVVNENASSIEDALQPLRRLFDFEYIKNLRSSFKFDSIENQNDSDVGSFDSVEKIMNFSGLFFDKNDTKANISNSHFVASDVAKDELKLNKIIQLTGLSDPVYAETFFSINQFDIVLDILVVNRTQDTLQNLMIEVATKGNTNNTHKSNKLVLPPYGYKTVKLTVSISSVENGYLYGMLIYDAGSGLGDENSIILDPIKIDVAEYTKSLDPEEFDFSSNWKTLDWENRIVVNTDYTLMKEFLNGLIASTNMTLLTPQNQIERECAFLVCNLGIESKFGEKAIANVSLEQSDSSSISGIIRLRADTEGMVVNMGNKLRQCMLKASDHPV